MIKMLKKYWEGKYPLAQSYWIGCNVVPISLAIPLLPGLMSDASTVSQGLAIFTVFYWGVLFFVDMFLFIGGFKSAIIYIKNKKKKKQGTIWGRLAQITLVLAVLSLFVQYIAQLAG